MQIIGDKALHLRVKNPARITASIRKSKQLGPHEVAVHWGLEEASTLRQLGISAPSPIEGRYNWPGRFKPMSHQKDTAAFLTLHERAFVLSDPGTGKTASAIWAADYLMKLGKVHRVLVVCPVSIMDAAWRADLFTFAMHRSADIAHGDAKRRKKVLESGAEFVIINFDGLEVVRDELAAGGFDLIIVDECFVAGTPVHTPTGTALIENLRVGDVVLTSSGPRPIEMLRRSAPKALVTLTLETGERLVCTPEHPFFTDWGWLPARALAGRRLIDRAAVSYMRGGLPRKLSPVGVATDKPQGVWADLLEILRSETVAPDASGGSCGLASDSGAAGQVCSPGVLKTRSSAPKDIRNASAEGPPTGASGRERHRDEPLRSRACPPSAAGMGVELPRSVGPAAARLSYELQDRLRVARQENWIGSGRRNAPLDAWQAAGPEEGAPPCGTRVETVEDREPACGEYVYNLGVSGTPNYFVGRGHLVHNCTAYKNTTTQRWKVLHSLLRPGTRLWMMTGTPAAQGPEDAYGLARLVSPHLVPKYKGAFRDMVMTKVSQFRWVPKSDATETVHRVLQPAIRFAKEDCLDLPDILYTRREVPMTKQQARYYHTLRKQMLFEAAGEQVRAANAAVLLNKLLQISAGAAYSDSGDILQFDIRARYAVLKEVIDETDRKVLVFIPYKHSMRMLEEALRNDGYACAVISGEVTPTARAKIFQDFQTASDPRILLIQPQAAAHGVTLTAADTVVWWSPTPSLETYVQANARIHRKGQTHKCTVVQLYSSPAEQRIYGMLDDKIDVHTKLVDLYRQIP